MHETIVDKRYSISQAPATRMPIKDNSRLTLPDIEQLATLWLFPGLLLAMVVGNQLWMLGPLYYGQMISWLNIAAAVIVVHKNFRNESWPWILVICIILTKGLDILFPIQSTKLAYYFFHESLFCIAGAVIAFRSSSLVYKQIMIICLLNVPIMFLQAAGIGEWAQFLAMEDTTDGNYDLIATLFQEDLATHWSVIQFRPSGFLYSNNRLSYFVLFGFALHFSHIRKRYLWGTLALCAMSVLSMAKIVFLIFLILVLFLAMAGSRQQKIWAFNSVVITVFLVGVYAVIFPGMFSQHLDLILSGHYFFVRINDILESFGEGSFIIETLKEYFIDTPTADWVTDPDSHVSGYSYLIPFLPFLVIAGIILLPLFVRGLRLLGKRVPHLKSMSILSLLIVVIYPAAVPVWKAPEYWFLAGFGLLPLFVCLRPRNFS
jgi:hypothetical protein